MWCSSLCGHIPSRPLTAAKRLDACAMAPATPVLFKSLTRCMPTVSIRPAPASSMQWQLLKISLFLDQTSAMHLRKPRHPNKDSTSVLTALLTNGGYNTRNAHQSHLDTSFQFCPPCRGTQNHQGFGRSTRTPFFARLASCRLSTNLVFTRVHSTANVSSSSARLMTLLLLLPTNTPPTYSWI